MVSYPADRPLEKPPVEKDLQTKCILFRHKQKSVQEEFALLEECRRHLSNSRDCSLTFAKSLIVLLKGYLQKNISTLQQFVDGKAKETARHSAPPVANFGPTGSHDGTAKGAGEAGRSSVVGVPGELQTPTDGATAAIYEISSTYVSQRFGLFRELCLVIDWLITRRFDGWHAEIMHVFLTQGHYEAWCGSATNILTATHKLITQMVDLQEIDGSRTDLSPVSQMSQTRQTQSATRKLRLCWSCLEAVFPVVTSLNRHTCHWVKSQGNGQYDNIVNSVLGRFSREFMGALLALSRHGPKASSSNQSKIIWKSGAAPGENENNPQISVLKGYLSQTANLLSAWLPNKDVLEMQWLCTLDMSTFLVFPFSRGGKRNVKSTSIKDREERSENRGETSPYSPKKTASKGYSKEALHWLLNSCTQVLNLDIEMYEGWYTETFLEKLVRIQDQDFQRGIFVDMIELFFAAQILDILNKSNSKYTVTNIDDGRQIITPEGIRLALQRVFPNKVRTFILEGVDTFQDPKTGKRARASDSAAPTPTDTQLSASLANSVGSIVSSDSDKKMVRWNLCEAIIECFHGTTGRNGEHLERLGYDPKNRKSVFLQYHKEAVCELFINSYLPEAEQEEDLDRTRSVVDVDVNKPAQYFVDILSEKVKFDSATLRLLDHFDVNLIFPLVMQVYVNKVVSATTNKLGEILCEGGDPLNLSRKAMESDESVSVLGEFLTQNTVNEKIDDFELLTSFWLLVKLLTTDLILIIDNAAVELKNTTVKEKKAEVRMTATIEENKCRVFFDALETHGGLARITAMNLSRRIVVARTNAESLSNMMMDGNIASPMIDNLPRLVKKIVELVIVPTLDISTPPTEADILLVNDLLREVSSNRCSLDIDEEFLREKVQSDKVMIDRRKAGGCRRHHVAGKNMMLLRCLNLFKDYLSNEDAGLLYQILIRSYFTTVEKICGSSAIFSKTNNCEVLLHEGGQRDGHGNSSFKSINRTVSFRRCCQKSSSSSEFILQTLLLQPIRTLWMILRTSVRAELRAEFEKEFEKEIKNFRIRLATASNASSTASEYFLEKLEAQTEDVSDLFFTPLFSEANLSPFALQNPDQQHSTVDFVSGNHGSLVNNWVGKRGQSQDRLLGQSTLNTKDRNLRERILELMPLARSTNSAQVWDRLAILSGQLSDAEADLKTQVKEALDKCDENERAFNERAQTLSYDVQAELAKIPRCDMADYRSMRKLSEDGGFSLVTQQEVLDCWLRGQKKTLIKHGNAEFFLRELSVLQKLKGSPFCLPFEQFCSDSAGKSFYLQFAHIAVGPSSMLRLSRLVEHTKVLKGFLSGNVLPALQDIAFAFSYMFPNRIFHTRVCLNSIWITGTRAILTDFDAARILSSDEDGITLKEYEGACCSVSSYWDEYAPPEVLSLVNHGIPIADGKHANTDPGNVKLCAQYLAALDLYALGACLAKAFSGSSDTSLTPFPYDPITGERSLCLPSFNDKLNLGVNDLIQSLLRKSVFARLRENPLFHPTMRISSAKRNSNLISVFWAQNPLSPAEENHKSVKYLRAARDEYRGAVTTEPIVFRRSKVFYQILISHMERWPESIIFGEWRCSLEEEKGLDGGGLRREILTLFFSQFQEAAFATNDRDKFLECFNRESVTGLNEGDEPVPGKGFVIGSDTMFGVVKEPNERLKSVYSIVGYRDWHDYWVNIGLMSLRSLIHLEVLPLQFINVVWSAILGNIEKMPPDVDVRAPVEYFPKNDNRTEEDQTSSLSWQFAQFRALHGDSWCREHLVVFLTSDSEKERTYRWILNQLEYDIVFENLSSPLTDVVQKSVIDDYLEDLFDSRVLDYLQSVSTFKTGAKLGRKNARKAGIAENSILVALSEDTSIENASEDYYLFPQFTLHWCVLWDIYLKQVGDSAWRWEAYAGFYEGLTAKKTKEHFFHDMEGSEVLTQFVFTDATDKNSNSEDSRKNFAKILLQNVEYVPHYGYEKQREFFHKIVEEKLSVSELRRFLQFATSVDRIPRAGFFPGGKKVRVRFIMGEPENTLPKAHTCTWDVDLPLYSTLELMEQKLKQTLGLGSMTFEFA